MPGALQPALLFSVNVPGRPALSKGKWRGEGSGEGGRRWVQGEVEGSGSGEGKGVGTGRSGGRQHWLGCMREEKKLKSGA